MVNYSAIIVDDETKARLNLAGLIEGYCPEITVTQSFSEGSLALKHLLKNKVDLVFLDVRMPQISGFDLLNSLKRNGEKIIIVSGYLEYGIEAVRANAFDYLLKPVAINDLRNLILRLENSEMNPTEIQGESDVIATTNSFKISVPHRYGIKVIDTSNIVRIESDNSYSNLFMTNGNRLTIAKSLKEFETELHNKGFYRVHNKHIINLKHMDSFSLMDGGFVTLNNNEKTPISRRRLQDFKILINKMFNRNE
ncbi:response regulator [bacterium]|nr:response regulator [bacterium]